MRQADLSEIQKLIARLSRDSAIGRRVRRVTVQPDDDGDREFLLVVVELNNLGDVAVDEVEPLVRSIEEEVAEIDERFPSVRFADAA